jgi:hypothetical protein
MIACLIDFIFQKLTHYINLVLFVKKTRISPCNEMDLQYYDGHRQDNQPLIALYKGCPLGKFIDGW